MRSVLLLATAAALLLPASFAAAETAAEKSMAQEIGRQLKESGQLRNYRIGVKFQDGVAWLSGSVTDAQQLETAVRLTEQMGGVSHVVCQLECTSPTVPTGRQASPNLFQAFEETKPAAAQSGPSNVVHAYSNDRPARGPRAAMQPRAGAQPVRNGMRPRNNMPLPTQRLASSGARYGVRQASAQGVPATSAAYPDGGAPGAMGDGMTGGFAGGAGGTGVQAVPVGFVPHGMGRGPSYENAQMPGYAWPSYASYPNYAALTYPQQYSPTAWPYIGPFYPYPQVPLAWRKVSLEWDDGWWFLDFSAHNSSH
jgi:hypothetical protein